MRDRLYVLEGRRVRITAPFLPPSSQSGVRPSTRVCPFLFFFSSDLQNAAVRLISRFASGNCRSDGIDSETSDNGAGVVKVADSLCLSVSIGGWERNYASLGTLKKAEQFRGTLLLMEFALGNCKCSDYVLPPPLSSPPLF